MTPTGGKSITCAIAIVFGVPAVGDPEADRQWQVYLARLSQQQSNECNLQTITVDSETGDIVDAEATRVSCSAGETISDI